VLRAIEHDQGRRQSCPALLRVCIDQCVEAIERKNGEVHQKESCEAERNVKLPSKWR
jgi:hypothetical protein